MTKANEILCNEISSKMEEALLKKTVSNFDSEMLLLGFAPSDIVRIKQLTIQYLNNSISSSMYRRRIGSILTNTR